MSCPKDGLEPESGLKKRREFARAFCLKRHGGAERRIHQPDSAPVAIDRPLLTFKEGPTYGRTLLKMWNETGIDVEVLS
jgi:hypothetical protein